MRSIITQVALRSAPQRTLLALRAANSHLTPRARQRQRLPQPSSSYSTSTKKSNPTSEFYKTFTRPLGRVLVLAIFTYQVAYWTWAKLEADDACAEADATIATLEEKVNEYKASRKGQ